VVGQVENTFATLTVTSFWLVYF